MLGLALDFFDFINLKSSFLFNIFTRSYGNVAQLLLLLNSKKFYLEPNSVFVIFGPNRSHRGAGISRNHVAETVSKPCSKWIIVFP